MVNSFKLTRTPQVIFGPGCLEGLPHLLEKFGDRHLVITGADSFQSGSKGKKLFRVLEQGNHILCRGRIIKEPSPADIDDIVTEYSGKNIDVVVGIGGGSVLDASKAVSAMLKTGESVKDYIEGVGTKKYEGIKIPFIAIPTTAGTGSEMTENAVISEVHSDGFKRSLRHSSLVPDIALVDPVLTLDCPPEITAASGMDALTQLIESYVSSKSNAYTDSLAEVAIKLLVSNLTKVYKDGNDISARTVVSYAAMISGITLANAGLGVVHGFASSVGGIIDIPHGILCGSLIGVANRIIVDKLIKDDPGNPALLKYAGLGKYFSENKNLTINQSATAFVDLVEKMVDDMSIPRIGNFGLKTGHLFKIIESTGQKNNPVKLNNEELESILVSRL